MFSVAVRALGQIVVVKGKTNDKDNNTNTTIDNDMDNQWSLGKYS